MKMPSMITRTGRRETTVLIAAGFAAGIVNGLLGNGGGVILTLALTRLFGINKRSRAVGDHSEDTADNNRIGSARDPEDLNGVPKANDIFAAVPMAVLPLSLVSTAIYAAGRRLDLSGAPVFIIPAAAGGICGALLLGRLQSRIVRAIFSVLIIYSGINMIF